MAGHSANLGVSNHNAEIEHREEMKMPLRYTEQRSIAGRIYSNLKQPAEPDQPKRPPIDGWAKQRQAWGEDDYHRSRGPVSPLGGKAK
jgi:hypothetical protein